MNYKDIPLQISYTSTGEDSFSEILNPLLSCTKVYKRSVGYFNSSALSFISDGLIEMARKGGKIMIATSPKLSDEDIYAIQQGYIDRDKIKDQFILEVQTTLKSISDDNAKILYMLVKEGIVDIKIVIRPTGMYHDKLALLEDYDGNKIACIGSNNETGAGYNYNYEKTRVYKSWFDYEGRIQDETDEFNSIWNNDNPELIVYSFTDAFQNEVLERVEKNGIYKVEHKKYQMRDYQINAKAAWEDNGHRGFFVMATGTGKTITSLYSIQDFINNNKIFTVIAVPYKHLVNQWAEDVREFFPDASVYKIHGEVTDGETKIWASYLQSRIEYKPIIIITTIKSFFLERYANIYKNIEFDKLLIVDEAHNFINCLNEDLDVAYPYKLGLSATPVFGVDESKTQKLLDWFGGQVVDLPIEKALGPYLVNYHYHPIFVNATEEDEEKFNKATQLMLSAMDFKNNRIINEDKFVAGFRGRLRAISMAEEKTSRIAEIFSNIEDKDHVIIYCSDGKLWVEDKKNGGFRDMRHLEHILSLINESCLTSTGIGKASKFTASEDVEERMQLIDSFNNGYIE